VKNLAKSPGGPYVGFVLRSGRFRLTPVLPVASGFYRCDGCAPVRAEAENPNQRACARHFKRLPYQGFCGLKVGMRLVGPIALKM
jgi:hypothetical protein